MARTTRYLNLEQLNFNNKSSSDYPILVNTTGYCDVLYPFETHNPVGRDDYYLIYITEGECVIAKPVQLLKSHTVARVT